MDDKTIKIRTWDSDSKATEENRETISVSRLARSITLGNFAALLDNFLNSGGKGFREGQEVGCQMRSTHRTLQRLAICFAIGLIVGLSDQEHSDPRNELAIRTAKKISDSSKLGTSVSCGSGYCLSRFLFKENFR